MLELDSEVIRENAVYYTACFCLFSLFYQYCLELNNCVKIDNCFHFLIDYRISVKECRLCLNFVEFYLNRIVFKSFWLTELLWCGDAYKIVIFPYSMFNIKGSFNLCKKFLHNKYD